MSRKGTMVVVIIKPVERGRYMAMLLWLRQWSKVLYKGD